MRRFVFAAAASLVLSGAAAAPAQTASDPMASLQFLAGHWSCTSVAEGKKSTYSTDWAAVPGGRWMRGTDRSGVSQSEDTIGYDATQKRWRTVDMEPDGTMSVLVSPVARIRRTCRRDRFIRTTRNASVRETLGDGVRADVRLSQQRQARSLGRRLPVPNRDLPAGLPQSSERRFAVRFRE